MHIIPIRVEPIEKIKINKIQNQKTEIKNRLKSYIIIALKKNTLKGFDAFVETFSGRARYKKVRKEYLIDLICELVGLLMQERKRNGRGDDLPKHPPKSRIDV